MEFTEKEKVIIKSIKKAIVGEMIPSVVKNLEERDLLDLFILRASQDYQAPAVSENSFIHLHNAFAWRKTPEGHDFWMELERKIY